jgi:MFS family permease
LFEALRAARSGTAAPLRDVVRRHWRGLLIAGGSRLGSDVMYSLLAAFTLTYLTTVLHESRTLALGAVAIGVAINAVMNPVCGALSDGYGRRRVGACGAALAGLWAFMFFPLLDTRDPGLTIAAVAAGFFIHAFMYGPQAAFIAEQFPTRVRYAGASLAYTMVAIVGGGIAPLVFATLWRAYRTSVALSAYLAAALCVTAIALFTARETSREPLSPD